MAADTSVRARLWCEQNKVQIKDYVFVYTESQFKGYHPGDMRIIDLGFTSPRLMQMMKELKKLGHKVEDFSQWNP